MDPKDIFRDTSDWYLQTSRPLSERVLRFAMLNSGKKILDVGCAVGEYSFRLNQAGYECVGVDINRHYARRAAQRGVEVCVMDAANLGFNDKSFDAVLLIEVLEHVDDPATILDEAKRVSRDTVVITVPNCTNFQRLKDVGLTYEHMLERDHRNFFTKEDLEEMLAAHFKKSTVVEAEPIDLSGFVAPRLLRYQMMALNRLGVGEKLYFRLNAVAEV